jgi:hypothetical protein
VLAAAGVILSLGAGTTGDPRTRWAAADADRLIKQLAAQASSVAIATPPVLGRVLSTRG